MSKMLSSWKEIAHFFGKGVRTVQRWEKTLDLPIHRPPGAPSNVVLARTSDLEEWMHRGPVSRAELDGPVVTGQSDSSVSLTALEREVAYLAEITGIKAVAAEASASAQDRVSALTELIAEANSRLSERTGIRAA
ncbi:hypothetical protein Terro_1324 [Terriglobus roseus DSM 18391]|uniref:Uncharacterized protein n=2 Tax=Terriglobus roseus TaxID=392734 RepID=I3ZEG5_TERRK|nr:hypothetical protein Terro_1324 [Terriglobus roseus DSM 18391]